MNIAPVTPLASQSDRMSARPPRTLILHADDFGLNERVNRGILVGFADGLLTSTSILANAPGCRDALAGWKEQRAHLEFFSGSSTAARKRLGDPATVFDLGVHLNLTQGRPLTGSAYPRRLLDNDGRFVGVFSLLPRLAGCGAQERRAIYDELCAQIETLLEHAIVPTHLNGHQYIELLPAISALIPRLLDRYRIGAVRVAWERGLTRTLMLSRSTPSAWCLAHVKRLFASAFTLRMRRHGARHPGAYFGTAHAGRIDLTLLRRFLSLTEEPLVEIGMHPGLPAADITVPVGWHDPLSADRPVELAMLSSPELPELLAATRWRIGRLRNLPPQTARYAA